VEEEGGRHLGPCCPVKSADVMQKLWNSIKLAEHPRPFLQILTDGRDVGKDGIFLLEGSTPRQCWERDNRNPV
jgi:hypothetical protein